mmetsp:Transcript_20149/g.30884  ORF Transcript_20149/g.30884 Transcript_20149/m.30884 type:complete len:81 (+) Transcript_20149:335-577(+)
MLDDDKSDDNHGEKVVECDDIDDDGDGETLPWKACGEHNGYAGHIRAIRGGNNTILRMLEMPEIFLYIRAPAIDNLCTHI